MHNKIFLSSDHGGFNLKKFIINFLNVNKYEFEDLGSFSLEPVDYSDYANLMAKSIKDSIYARGILLCGTGIGISIAANRHAHIRAALCTSLEMACKSRKHNDANVLVLGGRIISDSIAKDIVIKFLNTEFEEGRHRIRVDKLK
jgi:ribose 5-phosphate isomerase B